MKRVILRLTLSLFLLLGLASVPFAMSASAAAPKPTPTPTATASPTPAGPRYTVFHATMVPTVDAFSFGASMACRDNTGNILGVPISASVYIDITTTTARLAGLTPQGSGGSGSTYEPIGYAYAFENVQAGRGIELFITCAA